MPPPAWGGGWAPANTTGRWCSSSQPAELGRGFHQNVKHIVAGKRFEALVAVDLEGQRLVLAKEGLVRRERPPGGGLWQLDVASLRPVGQVPGQGALPGRQLVSHETAGETRRQGAGDRQTDARRIALPAIGDEALLATRQVGDGAGQGGQQVGSGGKVALAEDVGSEGLQEAGQAGIHLVGHSGAWAGCASEEWQRLPGALLRNRPSERRPGVPPDMEDALPACPPVSQPTQSPLPIHSGSQDMRKFIFTTSLVLLVAATATQSGLTVSRPGAIS